MKLLELKNKINEIVLRVEYLQNNISMTAGIFDTTKSRESDTVESSLRKLYDFEKIGNRVETTFNYIDSELVFLFDELHKCLSLVDQEEEDETTRI